LNLSAWLSAEILGLGFLLTFALLFYIFYYWKHRASYQKELEELRRIDAFTRLRKTIGQAIENGRGLQISIGSGGLNGIRGAAGLVSLSMLLVITQKSCKGDQSPQVTSGDGALASLAQDTLHKAYRLAAVESNSKASQNQVTGITPFSYAAGAMLTILDQPLQANLLAGNFGSEAGLLAEAGERSSQLVIAGSDGLPAQSVMLATADDALIGEELFAGGAYLSAEPSHEASVKAQDILRWIIILIILAGVILKLAGAL